MTEGSADERVRRRRRSTPTRRLVRRLRRLRQEQPRVLVLAAVGAVAALAVAWAAWVVWAANHDLSRVRDSATIMRAALVRADAEGARKAMAEYRDAAGSAHDRTSGPTWAVLEALPVLGDDAEGIATVAEVLDDIGEDGLGPIADAADLVTAETFQPDAGRFPVEQIAAMVEPARESEAAFDAAADRLAELDPDDYVGPVRNQLDRLRTLVTDARETLGSTYRAARIIPRMMGADRDRHYLLVMQNNAELRSGGGLPGALSLVRMRDGRVDIVEQSDMSEIGRNTDPVVRLTAEERRIFGRILGRAAVDATLTPDFQRSAEIIRARWEREIGGSLDGMFFIDPVAVSYLLRGTGPVDVPGFRPVDAGNVVWAVENEIYRLTDDRSIHSDYQQAVAEAVFDAFAAGRGSSAEAIRGLVTAVQEGRIRMAAFESETQDEIAGTMIAGEFSDRASHVPEVGVFINDGGPTKMQYYLRYDARIISRSCVDDEQVISGSIDFHSDTPPDARSLPPAITGEGYPGLRVEPGDQLLVVYVTSPVGGDVEELSIDGQRLANPVVERLAGRGLVRIGIELEPQSRHSVEFVMRSGPDQTADARLSVTPGAFPGSPNTTVPTSCAVR
ncbi:uncharacterized protein DUF4012 [Nocardioides sp. J9]|uniref:DUF4012 domain-containing protein n=1 Tax=unclassified Nocardioides TaxID=2615069 RepID=UPI00048BB6B9|nr:MULTISPECIES: DUF4012 domain-containing protein [unclassified Nocardioides]TWG93982.1 uncharacterized protein DUF4012 [Nocardioides sp. J9]